MKKTKAIALFSGGLDSILACKVVDRQGIEVQAVKFISPFFDHHLLGSGYCEDVREKYGINLMLVDISQEYIELLRAPVHGYGKHFNPCLDCKIFMMSKARAMMADLGASFLVSGEVVGQRPMSQRRDAMRVVERDSRCDGILLRPLCAKILDPTRAELDGLVDREQLCDFSGRSRSAQIALAGAFGVSDYPTPAGGCMLTDPVVGKRIKLFYAGHEMIAVSDMLLISVGRHFHLPGGAWLVVGRKESENKRIADIALVTDTLLELVDRTGPLALLRNLTSEDDLPIAAGVVARYGKKDADGRSFPGQVLCRCCGDQRHIDGVPPSEKLLGKLMGRAPAARPNSP